MEHRGVSAAEVLLTDAQRCPGRRGTALRLARAELEAGHALEGRLMRALTAKYIDSVVRHLPEDSRADIAHEISGLISDMIEGRSGGRPGAEQSSRPAEPTLDAVE